MCTGVGTATVLFVVAVLMLWELNVGRGGGGGSVAGVGVRREISGRDLGGCNSQAYPCATTRVVYPATRTLKYTAGTA